MSSGDEPAVNPSLIRAARVECRYARDPILESSCEYWPYDLSDARADELGQLHDGHIVAECLVRLAVVARTVEPRNDPTTVGRSMYLTAIPDDWDALVAAGQPLIQKVTVLPGNAEDLASLQRVRALGLARSGTRGDQGSVS
jgi:hypothetical protein